MSLNRYKQKRDFSKSPEPKGKTLSASRASGLFVIQKHAARNLHYDLRLAMNGVLKSWAVPKGLPLKQGERRLAIEVEDHPLEYRTFEGVIPANNYGAGTVMVWDFGDYSVEGGDARKMLAQGKLHFTLSGKKLHGDWALVRMKGSPADKKPIWLLLKSGKNHPAITKKLADTSAESNRSMQEIAQARDAEWHSNRSHSHPTKVSELRNVPPARPAFIEPMKARLIEELPSHVSWLYEIKFDGVRAITTKNGQSIRLSSRTKHDMTNQYPEITDALQSLHVRQAVIDGEIVALDEKGRSSFQLLQPFIHRMEPQNKRPPIVYYVFDLLNLEGQNLKDLPLIKRKELLEELVSNCSDKIRFSASFDENPATLLKRVKHLGLEGLIGKKRDSIYQPGQRNGDWIKLKVVNEQEFVIGGYTAPKGARQYLGSLIVGYYKASKLLCASKVGTGFDGAALKDLDERFQKLRSSDCPFADLPSKPGDLHGISQSQMKDCTWLKPKLVGIVKFAEWTQGGHLRQPVFLGLRNDKKASEVVREWPA